MQIALSIAGFDPSSGAGITADLLTFSAHGLFGTTAITALTVQSTLGVLATHPVSPEVLRATLDCIQADLPPAGIKIGMLATASNVSVVADFLEATSTRDRGVPTVLDPVLVSSSGHKLLDHAGLDLLRKRLLPLVDWITPNIHELGALLDQPTPTRDDLLNAAHDLQIRGHNLNVVVTGGHLDRPDDLLLPCIGDPFWLPGERITSRSTHGTGCAFASALLSNVVLGHLPAAAVARAKSHVANAIASAPGLGQGSGPLDNLWFFHPSQVLLRERR